MGKVVRREPVPELGAAMRVLSSRWQRLAYAIFDTRGDRSAALRLVGYKGTDGSIKAMASRIFSDQRMLAAIREEAEKRIDGSEPQVMGLVQEIMNKPTARDADRLKAADMWWQRSRPVEQRLNMKVEHHLTHDETAMLHYRALKQLGAPQEAFLSRFGINGLPRIAAMVEADDAKTRGIESDAVIDDVEYEEVDEPEAHIVIEPEEEVIYEL